MKHFPHNDPLVIRANISKNSVHFFEMMLGGFWWIQGAPQTSSPGSASRKWGSQITEKDLKKSMYPLIGFGVKKIEAVGKADIKVTFKQGATIRTEVITFDIVDIQYPYSAIFGTNIINKFATIVHQLYICMKIPTVGVLSVFGNQEEARRCNDNTSQASKYVHVIGNNQGEPEGKNEVEGEEPTEGVRLAEHTKKVPLGEDVPERTTIISKGVEQAEEERLNSSSGTTRVSWLDLWLI